MSRLIDNCKRKLGILNRRGGFSEEVYNKYNYYFDCDVCGVNVVLDMSPAISLPTSIAREGNVRLIDGGKCRKCMISQSSMHGSSRNRVPSVTLLKRPALFLPYLSIPIALFGVYVTGGANSLKSPLLKFFALSSFVAFTLFAVITLIIFICRLFDSSKQTKYLNLKPRGRHALTSEQAQTFDTYLRDKRYSSTCYKILKLIDKSPASFYSEALTPLGIKYLVGSHSYAKFYTHLNQSDKVIYLSQLTNLAIAKIKLSEGDLITEDDAISILLSVTTLTEIKNVKERFQNISADKIEKLASSDRPKTIGALNSFCFDNFSASDSWASLSLNDKVFSLEYRMTSYIQNNPNYKSLLKENYKSMGNQVKTHLLSELSEEELYLLLLDPELENYHKDPDFVQVIINLNKLNFLSLLVYYSRKHNIKIPVSVEEVLNDLLNIFKFSNYQKEWNDSILSLEFYNNKDLSLDSLTANNIGIYSLSLDEKDYLFTHKFSQCLLPISYRDDYDVRLGIKSFTENSDICIKLEESGTISTTVVGDENALHRISVNCIDLAFKNKLYMLSPYLVSHESKSRKEGQGKSLADFGNLFCGLSKETFEDFYKSISCESYPLLEKVNLESIRQRVEEAFLSTRSLKVSSPKAFSVNRKIYSSNFSLDHKWMNIKLAAGSKFINYSYGTSENEEFLQVLQNASEWIDLEKIIIVFANFPYRKKGYTFSSNELLSKYGRYGEGKLLLPLSKDLSVEELKLACSLLQSWEGSEKDFKAMIKTL